jgi:hypothetical protein
MSQPPMPPGPPTQPLPRPAQFPLYPPGPVHNSASTTAPTPPKPKKPKRFGWPILIITAVVALGVGIVGGIFVGSGDDSATTAGPTATVTATGTAEAESGPTASKAPTAKKTTRPEPESTMNEGTYEIGVDAKPGRYKTRVPEDSSGCYWEKLKDDSGGFNSLIANGDVNPGGRVSITLKRGEFFNSEDCGTWTRV